MPVARSRIRNAFRLHPPLAATWAMYDNSGAGGVRRIATGQNAEASELARPESWQRLNSEWYAMSLASPEVETTGAGFRVRSQPDRGLFYQNLCLGMLGNRNCVGWHWFKYSGDAQDSSRGFVDSAFEPHRDMTNLMRQLNTQIYPLRAALLPK